jgi:hypothetical protein
MRNLTDWSRNTRRGERTDVSTSEGLEIVLGTGDEVGNDKV